MLIGKVSIGYRIDIGKAGRSERGGRFTKCLVSAPGTHVVFTLYQVIPV